MGRMETLDSENEPFTPRARAVLTVLSNEKFMTAKEVDVATNELERKAKGRQRMELLSNESASTILRNFRDHGLVLAKVRK